MVGSLPKVIAMRASAEKWVALASLLALGAAPAAFGQGMMEYSSGVKLGSTGILNQGGARGMTGGYGAVGGAGASAGGTQRTGSLGTGKRFDEETVDAYAQASNKLFLDAQKKEKAGALQEAFNMYGQSADLRAHIWGDKDPNIIVIYKKQAQLAMKQGKLPQAETTYRKWLAMLGRKNGPGSPESEPVLTSLADVLEKEKKYGDAAGMWKQLVALELRKSAGDGTCPDVLKSRVKLAKTYLQAKQVFEAEESLRETIATIDAMPTPNNPALLSALQTLSSLLKGAGRDAEATPIDGRIATLAANAPQAPPATPPAAATPPSTALTPKNPPATTSAPTAAPSTTPTAAPSTTPPAGAATPPAGEPPAAPPAAK